MRLTRRAGNGVWFVDFRKDGKRVRVSTGQRDRAEAERLAPALVKSHLEQQAPVFGDIGKSVRAGTLAQLLTRTYSTVWKHQRGAREMEYRVRGLIAEMGDWTLDKVTYVNLNGQSLTWRAKGDSPATMNRKISTISRAMTEASKLGLVDRLPKFPRFAEENVQERYLTEEEEARLLAAIERRVAPAYPRWQHLRDLVIVLLDTGLRLGEALALTQDNLQDTLRGGRQIVLRHGKTKSGKGRSVPLTPRARVAVELLLSNPEHGKVTEASLYRRWTAVRTEAGIPDVTMHTLRHTCASRLVQAGVDLYRVQKWLGHSEFATTQRYAHLRSDDLEDAADTLSEGKWRKNQEVAHQDRGTD